MILFIALQLAIATPPRVAPRDSVKLIARARDAEFHYIMDWRHEWEMWRTALFNVRRRTIPAPMTVRQPTGDIKPRQTIDYDIDEHQWMAHFIGSSMHNADTLPGQWAVAPAWSVLGAAPPVAFAWSTRDPTLGPELGDEALGIDGPLPPPYRDTVRARRVPLLALLDSAAHVAPGDSWLVGQRVRMHVDQKETASALRATTECRAVAWWCTTLRGYVDFAADDKFGAAAAFDTGLKQMPPAVRCEWNDVSQLLVYSARTAYQRLSCAQQDSVNQHIWWLADPLYLVPANDRRTEHYARRVLAELHAGNDADEREDMRDAYTGPALREMLLRYGWPTTMAWDPPPNCEARTCIYPVPPGWSRFDTHDVYLGPDNAWAYVVKRIIGKVPIIVPWPALPLYSGPRYHTIPTWSAITDPLRARATDWNLGPERLDALAWDSSWWATEFYQRYEGPLVDLPTQTGFIRRHATAEIAAAMEWPTATTFLAPPPRAVVGVITSGGPTEHPRIASTEDDGTHPSAILTPVDSRPLLLGVEMVPPNDTGPAARTRFGIAPPQPLSALTPGTIALSDVMLVRATANDSFPTSIQDALPRMYGSTTLVNPKRLAIFWEVYGQNDGDTVDVSLRIVRQSDAGLLSRAAAAVGIGQAGSDSITVRWREPRLSDPLALADSDVSIRPRGFALDVSALAPGAYTLSVRVDRRGVSVSSAPREFNIARGSK